MGHDLFIGYVSSSNCGDNRSPQTSSRYPMASRWYLAAQQKWHGTKYAESARTSLPTETPTQVLSLTRKGPPWSIPGRSPEGMILFSIRSKMTSVYFTQNGHLLRGCFISNESTTVTLTTQSHQGCLGNLAGEIWRSRSEFQQVLENILVESTRLQKQYGIRYASIQIKSPVQPRGEVLVYLARCCCWTAALVCNLRHIL